MKRHHSSSLRQEKMIRVVIAGRFILHLRTKNEATVTFLVFEPIITLTITNRHIQALVLLSIIQSLSLSTRLLPFLYRQRRRTQSCRICYPPRAAAARTASFLAVVATVHLAQQRLEAALVAIASALVGLAGKSKSSVHHSKSTNSEWHRPINNSSSRRRRRG